MEKVKKSLAGIDTYAVLTERYSKEPTNIEVVFKLANKLEYWGALEGRAKELFQKVLALDPDGKRGSYFNENENVTVSYTEAAEYALGQMSAYDRKPDPAPLQAFIKKYPESKLAKLAFGVLSYYFGSQASKEEAGKFFEEYTAKYPEDRDALGSYVQRIIKDGDPLDKGLALAEKLKELVGYPQHANYQQNLAQLYVRKGDPSKAEEEYGKDFIDGYVSSAVSAMVGYANFWVQQGKNLDSAEATADLVAGAARIRTVPSYYLSQTASVYIRLEKTDKALAVYGPEFAQKNWGDEGTLGSYASYWNRQGKNLDSALEAAKRAVELTSDYFNNFILGQVLFKLKKYDDALKAAEKAVELVKPVAVKNEGFPTQQYEKLVKDIKDALAKEKGGEVKK